MTTSRRTDGRGILWKTGHSLIKTKMKQEQALLAGEMSGHIFFADRYFGFDDAIYATLRILEIVSKSNVPLHEMLRDVPETFATPEIRVECDDAAKFGLVEQILDHYRPTHSLIDIDGARIQFDGGWALVRASNTQPVLVLRFEADSEARLRRDSQRSGVSPRAPAERLSSESREARLAAVRDATPRRWFPNRSGR